LQQKEFEHTERQTLPQLTGVNSLVIENTGLSKLNFHGIRFKGRIQIDNGEATEQFLSGFVTLMCVPNDQIAIPSILNEATLNDSNSFIIAVEAWQMFSQPAVAFTYAGTYDFDIAPKTSRSCMKGGKIVGQVTNTSAVSDCVITTLLSTFETF